MGDVKVYWFGCRRGIDGDTEAGHYWYGPENRSLGYHGPRGCPWPKHVDAVLAPQPDVVGNAALVHGSGWTALSWWDRSGDSRPNSNTTLVAEGIFTVAEMLMLGRERYPALMARQAVTPAVKGYGERGAA